jgi:hypothetical protein
MAEELRKNSVQSSSTALFRSEVVVGKYENMEELRKNSVPIPKNKNSVQKREKERIRDLRSPVEHALLYHHTQEEGM